MCAGLCSAVKKKKKKNPPWPPLCRCAQAPLLRPAAFMIQASFWTYHASCLKGQSLEASGLRLSSGRCTDSRSLSLACLLHICMLLQRMPGSVRPGGARGPREEAKEAAKRSGGPCSRVVAMLPAATRLHLSSVPLLIHLCPRATEASSGAWMTLRSASPSGVESLVSPSSSSSSFFALLVLVPAPPPPSPPA